MHVSPNIGQNKKATVKALAAVVGGTYFVLTVGGGQEGSVGSGGKGEMMGCARVTLAHTSDMDARF
ncbi:beta-N-acetylhexosaminidase [Sesbania bispinosa]|nr:beta-N-acetylhexosaminidase [Sesbania bispinosa]